MLTNKLFCNIINKINKNRKEGYLMKLLSFDEFEKTVRREEPPETPEEPTDFLGIAEKMGERQAKAIVNCCISYLKKYHEWLTEQLKQED